MKTFSNAANLRGMLLHPDCPVILQEAMPIINKAWKMKDLLTDTADSTPSRSSKTVHSRSTVELELGNALAVFLQVPVPPHTVYTVREVKIGKYGFSKRAINPSQSRIVFQPIGEPYLTPGEVQDVFKLGEGETTYYLAVRRYLPPQEGHTTIFQDFPDFGATLVSDKLGQLEIVCADEEVRPTTSRAYGKAMILIKDSSRVSSLYHCTRYLLNYS